MFFLTIINALSLSLFNSTDDISRFLIFFIWLPLKLITFIYLSELLLTNIAFLYGLITLPDAAFNFSLSFNLYLYVFSFVILYVYNTLSFT